MFVLSFDALLVRLADVAAWDIVFWRGWLVCLALTIYLVAARQLSQIRLLKQFWVATLVIAALYALGSSLFVFSIKLTKVANTVLILSCTPFCAALFSWFILGERIRLRTVIAMLAATTGIVVVFAGAAGFGDGLHDVVGSFLALLIALITGLTLTLLRKYAALPLIPILALSGAVAGLLALPFANPLGTEAESLGWLMVMGLVQIPIAWICALTATRYIPAPEVSLFLLIETVLGPVWVWLVLGEIIPPLTLFGGIFILGAVCIHAWLGMRETLQGQPTLS
ncbi:MAG: EamA family transporter [unclassified Hahellaceae]|mgnify:CR=1 FL=1|nr:EamA family transporter [Hahellaceae bacterium]|tara:strand:+ start:21247 stop:22092 length:846 start_codon:yes stop_codon:yes gene_type:complete